MDSYESLHLHEILVVLLSEIILIILKSESMKKFILKVTIHLSMAFLLTQLECLAFLVDGQTITTDRFYISKVSSVKQ